jgi:hypothetical protein
MGFLKSIPTLLPTCAVAHRLLLTPSGHSSASAGISAAEPGAILNEADKHADQLDIDCFHLPRGRPLVGWAISLPTAFRSEPNTPDHINIQHSQKF